MIKDAYKQEVNDILSLFPNFPKKNTLIIKTKLQNLIKKHPNDMFLENLYGIFLLNFENLKEAIQIFDNLITKYPNNSVAHYNLALCYEKIKHYDKAREHLLVAIDLNNNYFEAFNLLGTVHAHAYNKIYAVKCFEKALEINKNYVPAIINLASIYNDLNYSIKAIKIIEDNIGILNDTSFIYQILGLSYFSIRQFEKGVDYFDKSLNLNFNILVCSSYLFLSSYFRDFERKKYFFLASKLRETYLKKNIKYKFDKINKSGEEVIKIGFVGRCFREHAVTYQILGVLNFLSKENNVELYAYSDNYFCDIYTSKLKKNFHFWKDIYFYSDQDTVSLIRRDNLDILVDLEGHSSQPRLGIFIQRCAPVQISWCGFLDSVGLPEIDYMIADRNVISNEQEANYSEKIVCMPYIWTTLDTSLIEISTADISFDLKKETVFFGSPAPPIKINDEVMLLWSKILNETNNTKLVLSNQIYKDLDLKNLILSFFINKKIDHERIIFKIPSNRNNFLENIAQFDIMLDTFPYSGGTTSLEAAWLGCPILTMEGNSFLSRCGTSVNINLGMSEWIAKNEDEYFRKAVLFSSNSKILSNYKKKLIKNRDTNQIFDNKLFSQDLLKIFKNFKYSSNLLKKYE